MGTHMWVHSDLQWPADEKKISALNFPDNSGTVSPTLVILVGIRTNIMDSEGIRRRCHAYLRTVSEAKMEICLVCIPEKLKTLWGLSNLVKSAMKLLLTFGSWFSLLIQWISNLLYDTYLKAWEAKQKLQDLFVKQ